jgi:DNA-binding beta-propeller fold protein YncE
MFSMLGVVLAVVLPNGWYLSPPQGLIVETGTMPQGAAASADRSTLAVVEAGFNPPALVFYRTSDLRRLRSVALQGASGRPAWMGRDVLVAGFYAGVVYVVDSHTGKLRTIALRRGEYPTAVTAYGDLIAVSLAGEGAVRIGHLDTLAASTPVPVGVWPGNLAFSGDATKLFVAMRSESDIAEIDVRSRLVREIACSLHPSDVLVERDRLYVAEADADRVGIYDVRTYRRVAGVFVGGISGLIGSSPNALAAYRDTVFVSLGASNEIVALHGNHVTARLPTGWYPTDIVAVGDRLYVVDGKGEGTKPNPGFDIFGPVSASNSYIAAIQYGSLRELKANEPPILVNPGPPPQETPAPGTILRKDGPIKHVFFILKENRTYDQVLGDMGAGDGDPNLVWFGEQVTPNQHALAQRFGLFDNFYASGEVSDAGHNWADAAFANDYVERVWPQSYGGRFDNDDDTLSGRGAPVPHNGYIWDAARRAGVTFRDYGEMALFPAAAGYVGGTAPSLGNRFDPRYVSWNLDYSDLDRVKEWTREFEVYVKDGTVPRLEYIWLPNDNTYGSRVGKFTPAAYIATSDYATGLIVSAISHSPIWRSSAVFITEDDAQDGADHVSDQRTVLYIASPYARGGVFHEHYSTVSVVRTMELLLGLAPLTTYDATALPLYAAFSTTPDLRPVDVLPPRIDLGARNSKLAYGERQSEAADFSRPDAVAPAVLTDILAHNHSVTPVPATRHTAGRLRTKRR